MIPHWLWAVWAIAGVIWGAWFGVMEGLAIADKDPHDTLSWVMWEHASLPAVIYFLGAGMIVFATIWLMLHFASGGKWGI